MSYLNNSQTLKAIDGTTSVSNSSLTPLGASETFTGTWESTVGFASIQVLLRTDQPYTFYSEFSIDGITVDRFFPTPITAPDPNSGIKFTVGVTGQFWRVRIVNGATPQSSFRLQSIFSPVVTEPGAGPLFIGMGRNSSTQAHRAAVFGQKPDGTYLPVQLATNGATLIDGAVSVGNFPATQPVSASSLPLPSGASTSANQSTLIDRVSGWPTNTPHFYVPVQSLVAGISLPGGGPSYLLAAVKKKVGATEAVRVKGYEGTIKTNDFIKFSLILNPTIAGSPVFADVTSTPLQSVVGVIANLVTGGREIDATYASLNMQNYKTVENGLSVLGPGDVVALVGTPALTSTNVNVTAYMNVEWV